MKHYIYIIIVILSSINLFSQGQANIWYFGENAGLDFNTCSPISIDNGQLRTIEGCSSFSDSSGNLLFYSDGTTVWNKNHSVMSGGTGLAGNSSSSQSAMIIPRPGSNSIYYIFTVGDNRNPGFNYYTIDMDAGGGFGAVTGSSKDLSDGRSADWAEKVAAVEGGAAATFWVVSYAQNEFYSYKVSGSGVANSPVRSDASYTAGDGRGYLKISPDGEKLAIAHMGDAAFILYDFDNLSGEVSNQRILSLPAGIDHPYGVEFSAESNKLYVHASNDGNATNDTASAHVSALYQFDLSSPNGNDIINSRVLIDSRNLYRGALQLGPDKKIYRALSQSYNIGMSFLGVINKPEEDGASCDYQHNGISLGSNNSTQGLPPFISSIFSQIQLTGDTANGSTVVLNDTTTNICEGEGFEIFPESLEGTAIYSWFFQRRLLSSNASLLLPNVSSLDSGDYKLVVEFTDDCGLKSSLEGEFSILVRSAPSGISSTSLNNCDSDGTLDGETNFNLSLASDLISNNDFGLEVTYYRSISDADAGNLPITDAFSFHSSVANPVFARAEDVFGCGYYVTRVDLDVTTSTFPANYLYSITTCDDETIDGISEFDLSEATSDIIAQFPLETNLAVSYYRSLLEAQLEQNQIIPEAAYLNETPYNQEIFVGVKNDNGDCFGIGQYVNLTVNPRPEFDVESEALLCSYLSTEITLETYNAKGNYTYRWTNELGTTLGVGSNLTVNSGGLYTVVATDLGCELEQTILVTEFVPEEILKDDILIADNSENNSITINTEGNGLGDGNYHFSLDNELGPFQESSFFENVLPGKHVVYVQATNGCGTSEVEIFILGFPNFFTPNNDGYNDSWGLLGLDEELYSISMIQIYDRFGKIVADLKVNSGWNGYYNGVELPASDYWFRVQLTDSDGTTLDKKGHFSLIRR